MKEQQRDGYDPSATVLLHAELERVLRCFGAARRHLTVVGGMVPGLLVPEPPGEAHAGSADVDLCLTVALASGSMGTTHDDAVARMRAAGYRPSGAPRKEFRWRGPAGVVVDFLYPASAGEPPLQTIRTTLEWEPEVAALGHEFAALAVGHGPLVDATRVEVPFAATVDGRPVEGATVHVTGPGGFVALKADAMGAAGRREPKDAYDVVWLLDALGPATAASATAAVVRSCPDPAVGADLRDVLDRLDVLFAPGGTAARAHAGFVAPPSTGPDPAAARFATATVAEFTTAARAALASER